MNKINYSQYTKIFLTSLFVISTLIGLFNWQVDAFGIFGNNRLGYFFKSEREIKQNLISHHHYDGLVMGSSKVAAMRTSEFKSFHVLNASWSAALPEEMFYFLRDHSPKVKFVGIGLDLFTFNESNKPFMEESEFRKHDIKKTLKYLLSIDMLNFNIHTIKDALSHKVVRIKQSGERNSYERLLNDHIDRKIYNKLIDNLKEVKYKNFVFSERRLTMLKEIKQWSNNNNVQLLIWINPLSKDVLKLLNSLPASKDFLHMQAEVKKIFPDVIDISKGPYSDKRFFFKHDPFHYYPSTADLIFKEQLRPRIRS